MKININATGRTVFGDLYVTDTDFARGISNLISSEKTYPFHMIIESSERKNNGKYSYKTTIKCDLNLSRISGYYFIYKFNQLIYIGQTTNLYHRIRRFLGEIHDINNRDNRESHPAAMKYKREYGKENDTGLSLSFYEMKFNQNQSNRIEKELIHIMRPRYNIEEWKSSFVCNEPSIIVES